MIMKGLTFRSIVSSAGLLLVALSAGCGSDSPAEPQLGKVTFSATSTADSRAGEVVGFYDEGSSFKVWATMHSADNAAGVSTVFDAQEIVSDGKGFWNYDGEEYWWPLMVYNFRALYPASVEGVSFSAAQGENASISVKNFDATGGVDLMAASDRRETGVGGKDELPVSLKFNHLLSRVSFRGRSDESRLGRGRRVIVTSASIYGVAAKGDWSGATGSWTATNPTGSAEHPVYKVEYPDGLELSTDGTDLFTGDKTILAIPQTLTEEARFVIEFHYNVNAERSFTVEVPLVAPGVNGEWKRGASIRYPFSVETGVFFSAPTVAPWDEISVDSPDFKIE